MKPFAGIRHIALKCNNLEACVDFYRQLFGFEIDFQPDANHVFLSSGRDNLALHRAPTGFSPISDQRLDHFGFMVAEPDEVDAWYHFLLENKVEMLDQPSNHRDGTRSFYCYDPDRNVVQITYHPRMKI